MTISIIIVARIGGLVAGGLRVEDDERGGAGLDLGEHGGQVSLGYQLYIYI